MLKIAPAPDIVLIFQLMHLSKLLESTFIQINFPKKTNIVVGSVYKHPQLTITDFNHNFLAPLLEKVSRERKELVLLGDFNINLLKH